MSESTRWCGCCCHDVVMAAGLHTLPQRPPTIEHGQLPLSAPLSPAHSRAAPPAVHWAGRMLACAVATASVACRVAGASRASSPSVALQPRACEDRGASATQHERAASVRRVRGARPPEECTRRVAPREAICEPSGQRPSRVDLRNRDESAAVLADGNHQLHSGDDACAHRAGPQLGCALVLGETLAQHRDRAVSRAHVPDTRDELTRPDGEEALGARPAHLGVVARLGKRDDIAARVVRWVVVPDQRDVTPA
eukprot:5927717-Prymnesium_polylepis.1